MSFRATNSSESISMRNPAELMQPERLGALKHTRLSFARLLMRRMLRDDWRVEAEQMDLDGDGVGRVVYAIQTPSRQFSFGIFSHRADSEENTDRIIATDWDLWAFLCEGPATAELMNAQFEELPYVMEGRATPDILVWTRANRSGRFFGHLVESLAAGHQPDIEYLSTGGYLMRSSGYYGNGLNGTKVFDALDGTHPLKEPYFPQMLSAWMLRVFGYDLAEEMAAARSETAVTLDADIKRYLGTGNSSGLGIIFYLVNHPQQLNAWLRARELALARAKSTTVTAEALSEFDRRMQEAIRWFDTDKSSTNQYFTAKEQIATELRQARQYLSDISGVDSFEWQQFTRHSKSTHDIETQEVIHSLLIDMHPTACEGLENTLTVAEKRDIQPAMTVSQLRSILKDSYEWALKFDFDDPNAQHYFWYRSIENEEPRVGLAAETEYDNYGLPIDIARQIHFLDAHLSTAESSQSIAAFVSEHPSLRDVITRIQTVHMLPYAEIHANPLAVDFVPLHFISCLKAIWGIQRAHPKSIGWVKGTFFQGAPLADELASESPHNWTYPARPPQTPHWSE